MLDRGGSTCKGTVVGGTGGGQRIWENQVGWAGAEGGWEGERDGVCVCKREKTDKNGVCRNEAARDVSVVRNLALF